jgi:hypothetical protein
MAVEDSVLINVTMLGDTCHRWIRVTPSKELVVREADVIPQDELALPGEVECDWCGRAALYGVHTYDGYEGDYYVACAVHMDFDPPVYEVKRLSDDAVIFYKQS